MGVAKCGEDRRMLLFEDVHSIWTEHRLIQEEAALLGVCARTFRRWTERWGEDGVEGLRDRRASRVARNATPVDQVVRLVDRCRTRHEGWNLRHFHSWCRREGGGRSCT